MLLIRDQNGDGCDDLLVKKGTGGHRWWTMYLGGSPMDTVPIFDFDGGRTYYDRAVSSEVVKLLLLR